MKDSVKKAIQLLFNEGYRVRNIEICDGCGRMIDTDKQDIWVMGNKPLCVSCHKLLPEEGDR